MFNKELISAIAMLSVSVNVTATETVNGSRFYAGLKGAYSDFSSIDWKMTGSGSWKVEDTAGYGLYAGYKLSDSWAIELEYLNFETETKEPQFNACNSNTFTCYVSKADYESDSYSIYGAYRTLGKLYFKGRLGYSYQESEFSKSSYGLPTAYESDISGSIGAGFKIKKIFVEAEYTYSTEYLSHLSAGVLFNF